LAHARLHSAHAGWCGCVCWRSSWWWGQDFYGAFEAQDFAKANAEELGVTPVPSLNLVCVGDETEFEYLTADEAKEKGLEVPCLP
jgi:hypothetical protein